MSNISPITGALRAVLTGIDLANADDAAIAALKQGLDDHLVVCVKHRHALVPVD